MMGRTDWITKFTALRFFLGGIETYIITPTAWYYIKSLDQSEFFLALVLNSFNVGSIIAGPVFGFLTDRFGNPKFMFISCNAIKFFASVMYSVNVSAYFPLLGRLITGIGSGGTTILLGQIALGTDEESRGKSFVFLEGAFCLGSAFGPAIGSLVSFRVNVLGWDINEGNSPGIVLAIIWLLFLILSLFLPKTTWVETGARSKKLNLNLSHYEDEKSWKDDRRLSENYSSEMKGDKMMSDSRILCLFFLIFSNITFSSTSTFYTPIFALDHFHLKLIHTKLMFLNSALCAVLIFICLYLASGYFEERKVFLIVLFPQLFSISLLTYLAFFFDQATNVQYYILLLYICLGMPYFAYPFANSILSKISNPRYATFIQGLTYATLHVAYVTSQVVVSFILTKTSLIYFSFGLVILWLVGIIWYGMLYKRMIRYD